jgi:hypothetical protein
MAKLFGRNYETSNLASAMVVAKQFLLAVVEILVLLFPWTQSPAFLG